MWFKRPPREVFIEAPPHTIPPVIDRHYLGHGIWSVLVSDRQSELDIADALAYTDCRIIGPLSAFRHHKRWADVAVAAVRVPVVDATEGIKDVYGIVHIRMRELADRVIDGAIQSADIVRSDILPHRWAGVSTGEEQDGKEKGEKEKAAAGFG